MNVPLDTNIHHLKGSPNAGLAMATFGFFVGFAAVALYGPMATPPGSFFFSLELQFTLFSLATLTTSNYAKKVFPEMTLSRQPKIWVRSCSLPERL